MNYIKFLEDRNIDCEKKGNDVFISCPFHSENDASCSVHIDNGIFNCFSCSESGSFAKLIAQIDDISIREAEQLLYKDEKEDRLIKDIQLMLFKDEEKKSVKYITKESFDNKFLKILSKEIKDYLVKRGINKKTKELFDIRDNDNSHKWKNRVIIPLRDGKNRILAFSGRTIYDDLPKNKKFVAAKGNLKEILFGLDNLIDREKKLDYLILVEGEFDCMSLQCGGLNAIATLGASGLSDMQKKLIIKWSKKLILCYDNDKTGQVANNRDYLIMKEFLSTIKVRIPEGFKDCNEFFVSEKYQVINFFNKLIGEI